ncbi:hypothetical protein CEXT_314461 [Caerostris extrusa]|uniref:Uncharacterized protein n=1 Tax=Caerostris extrusa TaxID=172846 RepID=A0AAV4U4F1_CAEEX|nr:hypothetical protein CEXT_314461 [Caerostris extrusa]
MKYCSITVGLIRNPTCINCGKRSHLESWERLRKAYHVLPGRNFKSRPIAASFAAALNENLPRQTQTLKPMPDPQQLFVENQDFMAETKSVLKELAQIFNFLSGIVNVYSRLLNCSSLLEMIQVFTDLFEKSAE